MQEIGAANLGANFLDGECSICNLFVIYCNLNFLIDKGQLISELLFGVFNFPKKMQKFAFNPIPTGHGRNQPIYERHVTKSGRNRVNIT